MAYTIHDAARSRFGRVVLVCPPTLGSTMADTFRRVTGDVIDIIAVEQTLPPNRSKPWGTAHAVLEASAALGQDPFGVANGDDWYGPSALASLGSALSEKERTDHVIVTYELARTMAFTDGVSRGRCEVQDGFLRSVEEILEVRRTESGYFGRMVDGMHVTLPPDVPVSMNLWGFVPGFLGHLDSGWREFQQLQSETGREFLLPHAVADLIELGEARVEAIPARESPFGLTQHDDLPAVGGEIARLVETGVYPRDLRTGIA